MKQSHGTSFLKACVSTGVGFAVSFVAQIVFLPMLGVAISLTQNTAFAIIMTVISVGRGYIMERVFEAMGWRTRMSAFALAVLAERQRQIQVEGWTSDHDDEHDPGELSRAGAAYAIAAYEPDGGERYGINRIWPWLQVWWKPTNTRRDLVKAAALIVAEGERHDRNRKQQEPSDRVRPRPPGALPTGDKRVMKEAPSYAHGKTRSEHAGTSA